VIDEELLAYADLSRLTDPFPVLVPGPSERGYFNRETHKDYTPHHEAEMAWVRDTTHRYLAALGGEGGGKTVAGLMRVFERVRNGCSGILVSPDLPHFKRSLWPEFKRWCPWDHVVASQQHRRALEWMPNGPFEMAFSTGAIVYCGGIEEPMSWEGPNVNWAAFDEARKQNDPAALKVLDGRVRIPGPHGEPAQLWLTTTPRKHWLWDYCGPIADPPESDPRLAFKRDLHTVVLLTADNESAGNLEPGFTQRRRQTLNEAEARVLLEAAWEDIDAASRFLPSMVLWDSCREALPPLGPREALVLAADAGVSSDTFALVGVTRHPDRNRREDIAVRLVMDWKPPPGGTIDFREVFTAISDLRTKFAIAQFTFDEFQMHDMGGRLAQVMWASPFSQLDERRMADKALLDLIMARRLAHDGNELLREHIDNADRKFDSDRSLRIVKRSASRKIDLAVALSMAAKRCRDLALG
jgi:hypothetical protein